MLKGAIVGGFGVLAVRLGYMQIVRGETYVKEASDNVVSWQELKPSRGLVVDRVGRPLAENRRTWAVRVIPSLLPDEASDDYQRMRDTLITALHLPETLIIDRNAIPVDARDTVYARIGHLMGDTTDKDVQQTADYIETQAKFNNIVKWFSDLASDQAARIRRVKQELPGVDVVNYLDYVVRNYRYDQTAITIRDDVSRDVALKLEANRLAMPGVVLDDSVLARRYPAGPSMSHILGYVGVIDPTDLNVADNILRVDDNGNSVYGRYQMDDAIGKNGLERKMEELLRGDKGGYFYEKNAFGVETRRLSESAIPTIPGRNIQLSIDLELQTAISKALAEGIDASTNGRKAKKADAVDCKGGAVVALDPRDGDVLAMVSYPQYDNQLFVTGLSQLKMKEYLDDPRGPLNDRAYAGSFPPGSTIKLFIALAGLREGKIDETTQFTCTGGIRVPNTWNEAEGNTYPCWNHVNEDGHKAVSVVDAIERSCDVFFYNTGVPKQRPEGASQDLHYRDYFFSTRTVGELHEFRGLGIDLIYKNLKKRFWFGQPTNIDLPFEADGLVPNNQWKTAVWKNDGGWSSGDTINTSIGQGFFLASPLQLAVNTAAIANGGRITRPKIVKALVDDGGQSMQTFDSKLLRTVKIDAGHLALVHEGMRRVVHDPNGTANHSVDADYQPVTKWPLTNPPGEIEIIIGGKTGTAEVGNPDENGIYSQSHAWFTCFAPFENPEIVVTVFLEKGGEGATYAVPIADKALRGYFELTGRRKRGRVLREDGSPITERNPGPDGTAPPAASPAATPTAAT